MANKNTCSTFVFFRKTQVYGNSHCVYLFPRAAITNLWESETTTIHSRSKKTEIEVRTMLLPKALGEDLSPRLPVCCGFGRSSVWVSLTPTSASSCTWPPPLLPVCLPCAFLMRVLVIGYSVHQIILSGLI